MEEKHKQLTARRKRMEAESVSNSGMLTELEEPPAPTIEFDEKLWHAVVDRVAVYNDNRPVYSLKDGWDGDNGYALRENRKVPEWHQGVMLFGEFGGCSYFGVERCIKSWYNRCYTITANKVEKVPSGFTIILA